MAEAFLFNIAGKIVGRLGSSTLQEIGLFWGVKDELEKLRDTVSTINAVLLDAEEQQAKNFAIEDWLRRIKDAVYEADDLLDDFSTQALRREVTTRNHKIKEVRIFLSKSNRVACGLKMGCKIKEIRKRLDAIADDRSKFHLTERTLEMGGANRERQQTHSFVREEEVVGREEEKKAVLDFLLDTTLEDNVSVIPIVGIGGLGKTRLAQLVYNDKAVHKHFELKMWLCVPDDFDVKTIAEKIIECASDREMDRVQQDMRKKIEGKRYLLVLDDVWNENRERWLNLKSLLMDCAKGSKVIVTTRSEKVAKITGTVSPFHLLGLDEERSWVLFTRLAFEKGEEPKNPELVAIGKEIVKKCVGVPLAIRTIGSLLYFKSSQNDWLYFKTNDLLKISQQDNDLFAILKVSYDHLPSCLKNCFAYCSLFPKNFEIERETLIQLWMAQGFIESLDENRCLEDVGDDYFMSLLCRSFFQDVKTDTYGNIRTCKMHDLIHDLSLFISGNECTIGNLNGENIGERTHHLSFGFPLNSSWKIPPSLVNAKKLRTCLLPLEPIGQGKLDKPILDSLISSFNCLRVLDLHGLNSRTLPNSIGKLNHLRYLDLSKNHEIVMLPPSITRLQNLQTLKLSHCYKLKVLPRDIKNLTSLRYLELDNCHGLIYMPFGLGQLISLKTLTMFVLNKKNAWPYRPIGAISELSGLSKLRGHLHITGLEHLRNDIDEVLAVNLLEKQHLQSIALNWRNSGDGNEGCRDEYLLEGLQPHSKIKGLYICGYGGVKFAGWVHSLSNLFDITIGNCQRLKHLPLLHQLPHLQSLCLDNLPTLEYICNNGSEELSRSSAFFPSLKQLRLKDLLNLMEWVRREVIPLGCQNHDQRHMLKSRDDFLLTSFPCLAVLLIQNCPKLIAMPLHPYVEDLSFANVNEKVLEQSLRRGWDPMVYSSSNSPLSRLRSLSIERMSLKRLPHGWLPYLSSLQELRFAFCPFLSSLSRVVQHLSDLHRLEVHCCKELNLSNDKDGYYGMEWKLLKRLRFLVLDHIPKLEALPGGLQHVTTLQHLEILNCDNLVNLPEWICNLSLLQELEITQCQNLTKLPVRMHELASLRKLKIADCPQLK
ncbi:NBS-LRR type disease resistance protein [Quillaja saponaria]|uniref:NBS-LRR type disease resistance protein n=1 Tax=Quillaja saponaria TaxID=32244 RepID=A0AAD7L061_QUISA|nr:NBS-LRR type disease resistance protein [Quillaja saponaria]